MRRRRKFQFISSGPNLMKNLIWPIELWSKILIPFEFQGAFLVRTLTKKNHITNMKSALRTVLIGMLFHVVSFHVKSVLQNVKNLISVSKNHANSLNWWTVGGVWKEYWRFLTIDSCIWSHFKCSMVGSIVPPFSKRESLFPLMLLFRGEATKTFVDYFSPAIYLWVINWTLIQFCASEEK